LEQTSETNDINTFWQTFVTDNANITFLIITEGKQNNADIWAQCWDKQSKAWEAVPARVKFHDNSTPHSGAHAGGL